MAAAIFGQALLCSHAEGADRNVLLALADAAGHDGVTWLPIGDGKNDVDRTISRLARVSKSTAIRAIAYLRDELGEIQTVRVRRGRSFTTVYRVLHGAQPVDYSRIPFEMPHRFDEPEPIHGVISTPSTANVRTTPAAMRTPQPSSVHGVKLTPSPEHVHGVKSDTFTVSAPRAGVNENRKRTKKSNSNNAAADLLDRHLRDLGVSRKVRHEALADPERAKAWLELAATAATLNTAGFFASGFTAGEWPSRRAEYSTPADSRREWIENTSWRLDPEDAHRIVDDWRDIDDIDRQELHDAVDRAREARAESEAA